MTAVDVRDMSADEARASVDRTKAHVAAGRADLIAQWRGRAWLALGYASWDALCDAEYGVRLALPREERREAVAELRAEGMSTRAIGSALGVSPQTVTNDLGRLSNSGQSDPAPARVTSLDGRERPAVQPPRPAPEPTAPPVEPKVAGLVEAVAESAPDLRRLRIRADFMRWLQNVGPFDVEAREMAELLEGDDEWARIERRRDDVTAYLARLVAERPRTLRSVGGNRG